MVYFKQVCSILLYFLSTEILTDREKTGGGRPKQHLFFSVGGRERLRSDRFPTAGFDGRNHRRSKSQQTRPPTEKISRQKLSTAHTSEDWRLLNDKFQ
jgi:hypothetical protein